MPTELYTHIQDSYNNIDNQELGRFPRYRMAACRKKHQDSVIGSCRVEGVIPINANNFG